MKIKRKIKGYTLIELLVVTGVLSLAAIGVYTVAMVAGDWRKSSQEVKSLNLTMKEIDNATVTAGTYTGITLSTLNNFSTGFNSNLQLMQVTSPDANRLNFVYSNVTSRVCSDFASKMLSSSNNVGAIINGAQINSSNLGDVVSACATGGLNDVTIVFNKTQNANTIDTVVASVNPPAAPTPDIVIPTFGGPTALPNVPGFVPSTASTVTYPLTTGSPPSFGPVVGGGGPISVTTPSSPITPSNPSVSTWNPPYVYIPPATPAPLDALDQDPNPPAPPPPPPPPRPTYLDGAIKPIKFYRPMTQGSGSQWAWDNVIQGITANLRGLYWENLNLVYSPLEVQNPRWLQTLIMRHGGSGNYIYMCPTLSYDVNYNQVSYPQVRFDAPHEEKIKVLREYFDKVQYIVCIEFGDDGGQ